MGTGNGRAGRHAGWAMAFWVLLVTPLFARAADEQRTPFRFQGGEKVLVQVGIRERIVELSQLVTDEGMISIPEGGGTLSIISMTVQEATEAVATRVRAVTGLRSPAVSLAIGSLPPRYAYIQGEVAVPQALALPPDGALPLMSAMAQAGGMKDVADISRIKIIRQEGRPGPRVTTVDASAFSRAENESVGPVLHEGDVVLVPRAEAYYVTGEVVKPGAYCRRDTLVPAGQPIRASHLVATACGFKPSADRRTVRVVRADPNGDRKTMTCNLEAAMEKGDLAQDLVLRDGDHVLISASEGILLMGRVGIPGVYYPVGAPMTVSRLIAMGGGFGQYAKRSNVLVIRKDKPGQPLLVDMKRVFEEGRIENDLVLEPGDMVFVSESSF